jgi:hypothetical protein
MRSGAISGFASLALVAVSCGGLTHSDDGVEDLNGFVERDPPPDEAAGGPYAFCRWDGPGGYEPYCAPTEMGWGYYNWHVGPSGSSFCEGGDDCNACTCFVSCSGGEPDECPAVDGVSAKPECLGPPSIMGGCWLTCDGGESCPGGMSCVYNMEYARHVCAWVE